MRRIVVATFALVLGSAGLVAAAAPAGAVALPGVTVGDLTVRESDVGKANVKVPVDLSVPATSTVAVPYSIAPAGDGSAQAADGSVKKGTLKFAAGSASKAITFTENGDTLVEPDQHFVVTLGAPTGATLRDPTGAITIEDNDDGTANPLQVSLGSVTVSEADAGAHDVYLPIILSAPAPSALSVRFQTNCATASLLTDFTAKTTGRINFSAGQQVKSLTFKIEADTTAEDIKSFSDTLASTVSGLEIIDPVGVTTIIDDDGPWQGGNAVPSFQRETLPTSSFDAGTVGSIEQVSVNPAGGEPHYPPYTATGQVAQESSWASTTADGSAVLFESNADDLVPGDTNGLRDLFVRDRRTGTTERVSVKADGSQITAADFGVQSFWTSSFMFHGAISANGRYVVFVTSAKLVAADHLPATGDSWIQNLDAYRYDRVTHTVELETVEPDGSPAGGAVDRPGISANGRYVLFGISGGSSALMPNDAAGLEWTFVRDRQTGSVTRTSNSPLRMASISADGSTVVGTDPEVSCVDGGQVLAVDLSTGDTERVDVTSDGEAADSGLDPLASYSVSPTGRYVGFSSHAWNLVPGQLPVLIGNSYVLDRPFLRDRLLGTTTALTDTHLASEGVDIDATASRAVQLVGGRDEWIDTATLAATPYGLPYIPPSTGSWSENTSFLPGALSADGRYLVFTYNLTSDSPPTNRSDVYIQRIG